MLYWDTSALLKLYVREPDSPWFLAFGEKQPGILTSNITLIEITTAIYRAESRGNLNRGAAGLLAQTLLRDVRTGRVVTVAYGNDVVEKCLDVLPRAFVRPHPIVVRSSDIIQIASALVSGASTIVATDLRLRSVAQAVGLRVEPV